MDTTDAHETPAPALEEQGGRSPSDPLTVDALLRQSARGDRASFSAFYDATVPWVHGMAAAMFRSPRDAAEATLQTYLAAWEAAPEAELDLSEKDDAAHRERLVFAWLEVLAHRVMTGLLREEAEPGRGRLPDGAGPAASDRHAPPEDLSGRVDPAAFEAVRGAWLGGLTDAQLAERLGLPRDTARTLVRTGVRQLTAAHRTLARGLDQPADADAARTTDVPLGATTAEDLEAGRGAQLADLAALHALSPEDHAAAVDAVRRRGGGDLAVWRSRVDGARRAVTWAFRGVVAEPPSALLDDLLHRLPAPAAEDAAGRPVRPPRDRRRPLKIALLALLTLLVVAAGAWVAWDQFSRPGIVHRVESAQDLYTTSTYPGRQGGTLQAFLSPDQNSGFVTVNGMPRLPEGRAYQVWLYPKDGSAPSSLGQYGSGDFGDPLAFRGLDRFAALSLTEEADDSPAVPTSKPLVSISLDPGSHTGPQYGGRPSGHG